MLPRPPLHYPAAPFHDFLRRTAATFPERVAVRFASDTMTYRELEGCSNALANVLLEGGVRVGERVLLALPNSPEWLVAEFAISQVGAAAVLVNSNWRPTELAHSIALTKPNAVIASGAAATILDEIGVDGIRICADGEPRAGWAAFWPAIQASSGRRPSVAVDEWASLDVALPFSSGTTGLPKAVRHTHASLVAATIQVASAAGITAEDRLQFFMPLFHIYGVVVIAGAIAAGAPVRLFPRFDAEGVLTNIANEQITLAFGAAPVAVALDSCATLERHDLSSLRYFMWGATPVARDLADRVSARSGIRWLHAYGATEAPMLHGNPVERPDLWRLDSPGLPVSDQAVKVVDVDGRHELPVGLTGEILVRGPHVMAGYLPPEATNEVFEDGWLRTGDIGWVEPDGWLHITDRAKEIIRVNAFQVPPAELEALLTAHPSVADCAVYGVPDQRTGEAPKAAILLRLGHETTTAEELILWVTEQVATYKRLRGIRFVDEIPRNPSGKVLRRVLRETDPEAAAHA
jgi:long-chain acyl-CoA synthetase